MRTWVNYLVLLVVVLAAWQLLYLQVGSDALLGPVQTIEQLVKFLRTKEFWIDIAETMKAFSAALAISTFGGLGFGIYFAAHRLSGAVAEPLLIAGYSIPKVTLYPVVLLLFGLGMPAKICFGVMHGIIPIVIFTMNGIRQIDPIFLRTARALRTNRWDTARTIMFPAALPQIVTGLRVGFSLTLLGTLIGEMFGSQHGLGFVLMSAIGLHQIPTIMAVTTFIVVPALIASFCFLAIENRLYSR
jgi:NitT/TauT family transport system permease protein